MQRSKRCLEGLVVLVDRRRMQEVTEGVALLGGLSEFTVVLQELRRGSNFALLLRYGDRMEIQPILLSIENVDSLVP